MKHALALLIPALMLVGCGAEDKEASQRTQITILGTIKSDIGPQFEQAVQHYNESQSEYELRVLPVDGNAYERMTALYASRNAPTIMVMGQETQELKDRLMDFSQSELLTNAYPGTYETVKDGDRVLGLPISIEAFGFLYNKSVLDQAFEGNFQPETVDSQLALEQVFEKVAALESTRAAVSVSPMDWSLGAHYSNLMFTNQSDELQGKLAALDAIKSGDIQLADNAIFNGWVDTFDMMMANNTAQRAPLAPTFDESAMDLASGNIGLWFQGNWAYPLLNELNPDVEYGILPVPVSQDSQFAGNKALSVGASLFFTVDKTQSTEAERQGAQDFLKWLLVSEDGQRHYVDEMNFIPPYSNFTRLPQDSMTQDISRFMQTGQTLDWMNLYYPGDAFPSMGASMQKYLAGVIDRQGLADEIEKYWNSK